MNKYTDKKGVVTLDLEPEPASPPPRMPGSLLSKGELRILVLSDMHLPHGESRISSLIEKGDLLARHDIVVLLGDSTASYGTKGEYDRVAKLLARLPLPYLVVNGNHETRNAALLLLGVDEIEKGTTRALVYPGNEAWIADQRIDAVKYYEPGRRPYYLPSNAIRERLRGRTKPNFWVSGHVHFQPSYPLSEPYLTDDGVWQIHCPDCFGFGRREDTWIPSVHNDFHFRSIELSADRLVCTTYDAWIGSVIAQREFPLNVR